MMVQNVLFVVTTKDGILKVGHVNIALIMHHTSIMEIALPVVKELITTQHQDFASHALQTLFSAKTLENVTALHLCLIMMELSV